VVADLAEKLELGDLRQTSDWPLPARQYIRSILPGLKDIQSSGEIQPTINEALEGAYSVSPPIEIIKEREEIVPVYRICVVCYQSAVQKIFTVDFIDDVVDFTASSEIFNEVLRSARFLV
jgi:hypothetical protein